MAYKSASVLPGPGLSRITKKFRSAYYVAPEPEPEPEPANGQIWGSGQSMAPQLIRGVGVRGTVFSVQFKSDENGTPWTVHRLVNHMRSRRNPSVVRTEK